jgi:hypothetical protein
VTWRSVLSAAEARTFLGLPEGYALPDDATLLTDARAIVKATLALDVELAEQGIYAAPLWEDREGKAAVRLCFLPRAFRQRYFEGEARETIERDDLLGMVAQVAPLLAADPQGAAFALGDTQRVYWAADAPLRRLEVAYVGHARLLSLVIADLARKTDGGLDTLEWLASLGLPLDEVREPDDPEPAEVAASMREAMRAVWLEERGWSAKS